MSLAEKLCTQGLEPKSASAKDCFNAGQPVDSCIGGSAGAAI
jgi:hypothetical protein